MTSFYLNLERLRQRQWNWGVVALTLIFLGIALAPTHCQAQAVPTRNQYHIMTRPIVPPPEPPLQKEIRETRQELEAAKAELARKIDLEKTIRFANEEIGKAQRDLYAMLRNPYADPGIKKAMSENNCKKSTVCYDQCLLPFIGFLTNIQTAGSQDKLNAMLENPFDDAGIRKALRENENCKPGTPCRTRCMGPFINFLRTVQTLHSQIVEWQRKSQGLRGVGK